MEKATLLATRFVTHDVKQFIFSKPSGFDYAPGQATHLALDMEGWRDSERPFTPTSLNADNILEFTIKAYPSHDGVTKRLHSMKPGDQLLVSDVFGTIIFDRPGYFIAGGAGITPFIAIMRDLKQKDKLEGNSLLFSNKTERDIILHEELLGLFGEDVVFTLTDQKSERYAHGRIDMDFLEKHVTDFTKAFYICGPPTFVKDISAALEELGADPSNLVFD
ncbi:MAG: FAD-binding oxidoreductase [Nanoarchaeota archaeon]